MQFKDECLAAKITLLTSLQSGKMEEALEKVEWLHRKHPSDTTIKELKRVINKRIQQLKILDAETDSSSEEEESESDEGYADAEFTNSSSEEEEEESEDE